MHNLCKKAKSVCQKDFILKSDSIVDRRSRCGAEEQPGNHQPGLLQLPQSVWFLQSGRYQRQERLSGNNGTVNFPL